VTREERRRLVARLRAIDHPEARALADELAAGDRPAHRPPDPPRERLLRRAKRVIVANAIYAGTFPLKLAPPGDRPVVERARGSRARSDAAAATLIAAGPETVRNARRPRGPMDQAAWEELKELFLVRSGN